MFRVDRANKIAMPAALQALAPTYDHYRFVSAMFHVPIWIVRALRREDSGDGRDGQCGDNPSRIQVAMFGDPDEAIHVAGFAAWEWVSLYVMRLDRVTEAGEIELDRCLQIDRCIDQVDSDPRGELTPCLRVTTTRGVVVLFDSMSTGDEPVESVTLWRGRR